MLRDMHVAASVQFTSFIRLFFLIYKYVIRYIKTKKLINIYLV